MFGELQKRLNIIRDSYIKIFPAGEQRKFWYPYRLGAIGDNNEINRQWCFEFMLDSNISDDEVTNKEVIEAATEKNATYVIPKDYVGDVEATTESVNEFVELYKDSNCPAKPIIPLQPPHDEHYQQLKGFPYYAVGGIKRWSNKEQLEAIRSARRAMGKEKYLHALGVGVKPPLVRAIHKNPNLVDSVDASTTVLCTAYGEIQDANLVQHDFDYPRGEKSSEVTAEYSAAALIGMNYAVSPYTSDWEDIEENSGLNW